MSIKFKVIERPQPGVVGGGTKKFYASAKMTGAVDIDDLTRYIEKTSTVSGADIRAVLYALVEAAANELADSKIVRLGDLGSLKMSVSSHGHKAAHEVKASAIKRSKVVFFPGKKFREMQKGLTYKEA